MIQQILLTMSLLVGYVGFIYFIEYLYKKFDINAEYTRKLGHIVSSLSCTVLLLFIESHWYILFLGLFFFLFLYLGRKYKLFKSIDSVKRKTSGSYIFPIAIYLVFLMSDLFDNKLYFILPMIIMGISDSLAGTLGTYFSDKTRKIYIGSYSLEKTYLGSMSFLLSSFIISLVVLYFYGISFPDLLFWSLGFAVVTTITEALSPGGSDNMSVPIITVFMIWLMV